MLTLEHVGSQHVKNFEAYHTVTAQKSRIQEAEGLSLVAYVITCLVQKCTVVSSSQYKTTLPNTFKETPIRPRQTNYVWLLHDKIFKHKYKNGEVKIVDRNKSSNWIRELLNKHQEQKKANNSETLHWFHFREQLAILSPGQQWIWCT